MKISDPTEGTIFKIKTTISQLKEIADITHTICTMADLLNVDCVKIGIIDRKANPADQIDVAFYNGEIMIFDENSGQFKAA